MLAHCTTPLICRRNIDHKRAGLKNEWDPRGTLFFIKGFEEQFDRGKVCLVVRAGRQATRHVHGTFWAWANRMNCVLLGSCSLISAPP